MTAEKPRRHHYVPQFYLRRFACPDDANKVRVVERHGDILAIDRNPSIASAMRTPSTTMSRTGSQGRSKVRSTI